MLQPLDRDRHVELLGCDVVRQDGRLVVRGEPQPPARLGLEIKAAGGVHGQRQVMRGRRIGRELDDGAAIRLDPQRDDPRHHRDPVRPGAGSIDQDRGIDRSGPGLQSPAARATLDRHHPRIDQREHAGAARPREIIGVEPADIDIAGARLAHAPGKGGREPGNDSLQRGPVQRRPGDPARLHQRDQRLQRTAPGGVGDMEAGALHQIAARFERGPRGGGERLDQGAAIGLRPESSRAPGGMIARILLRLDQQDARPGADHGSQAGTGHTRADDGDIDMMVGHGATVTVWQAWSSSLRT